MITYVPHLRRQAGYWRVFYREPITGIVYPPEAISWRARELSDRNKDKLFAYVARLNAGVYSLRAVQNIPVVPPISRHPIAGCNCVGCMTLARQCIKPLPRSSVTP